VSWGGNNRTHMVRVPGPGPIEYRLADGAANPYLLQAALLAAGLDGIAQERGPGKPLDVNMYVSGQETEYVRRLPLSLLDALRAFEAYPMMREALGETFVSRIQS
jgi:glutamine synthetase